MDESKGGCKELLPELLCPRETGLPVRSGEILFTCRIAITEFRTIFASASSFAPDREKDSIDSDRRRGLDDVELNFPFSVVRNSPTESASFESGERCGGGAGVSSR